MIDKPVLLDLKSVPCPLNVVKCKLALDKLSNQTNLFVELDRGEPEFMVTKSLTEMGYRVEIIQKRESTIKLLVRNELK